MLSSRLDAEPSKFAFGVLYFAKTDENFGNRYIVSELGFGVREARPGLRQFSLEGTGARRFECLKLTFWRFRVGYSLEGVFVLELQSNMATANPLRMGLNLWSLQPAPTWGLNLHRRSCQLHPLGIFSLDSRSLVQHGRRISPSVKRSIVRGSNVDSQELQVSFTTLQNAFRRTPEWQERQYVCEIVCIMRRCKLM